MRLPIAQLPETELIDTDVLLNAIVDALCPKLDDACGVECLVNVRKRTFENPNGFPFAATADHRNIFQRLLRRLPPVHGRMTDEEAHAFVSEFRKLPNKPISVDWEPEVITQAVRDKRDEERRSLKKFHEQQLGLAISNGEIHAFDAAHLAVKNLSWGVFIHREEATSYLSRIGFNSNGTADKKTTPAKFGEQLRKDIVRYKRETPSAKPQEIANALGCSRQYVSKILAAHKQNNEPNQDLLQTWLT